MYKGKKIFFAIVFPLLFLFVMWMFYFSFWVLQSDMSIIGIRPRRFEYLFGLIMSVFAHSNINHILSNSISFLVLATSLFYFYRRIAYKIFFLNWFISGFLLWIGGRSSVHIGASGIIYGLAFFIFFSGMFRKTKSLIALSFVVVVLYGGMVWGMMPIKSGISWEGHLFGAISGLLLAWAFRKHTLEVKKIDLTNTSTTLGKNTLFEYEYKQ